MSNINDILNGKAKRRVFKDKEEKIEVDRGGRPRKDTIFKEEREKILKTILEILSVDQNNCTFFVDCLDNDIVKQNQILVLENDIKKYFSCHNWKCFAENGVQKKHISMSKHVLKHMNYELTSISLIYSETRKVLRSGYIISKK